MCKPKILDYEFKDELYKMLTSAGVERSVILNLISKEYKKTLKAETISILENLLSLVKEDKYTEIVKMISLSSIDPAGYRCFIDFSEIGFDDIGEIIEELGDLKISR